MAAVKDIVARIRTAVLGREVRDSIADGIEAINDEVSRAVSSMEIKAEAINDISNNLTDIDANKCLMEDIQAGSCPILITDLAWEFGNYNNGLVDGTNRIRAQMDFTDYAKYEKLKIITVKGFKSRVLFFNKTGGLISLPTNNAWHIGTVEYDIPSVTTSVYFCLAKEDDSDMAVDECVNMLISTSDDYDFCNNPINYFDYFTWMIGKYYSGGILKNNEYVMSTEPVRLWPGAKVRLSSFYYDTSGKKQNESESNVGARVSFWHGNIWKADAAATATRNCKYVVIPDDCDSISLALWTNDPEKYVYIADNNSLSNAKGLNAYLKNLKDVNPLFGKKISILGDSVSTFGGNYTTDDYGNKISDGVYTYPGNRVRYPQDTLTSVNDTYWMRLINKHNMELNVNDSWAGSLVSWDGETESMTSGGDIHISSQTRINHLGENGEPDIILVFAGSNDVLQGVDIGEFDTSDPRNLTKEEIALLPVDTFANAYRTMLIRLMYRYPMARIICILPYFVTHNTKSPKQIDAYNDMICEICNFFGVKTIDARCCGMTMWNRAEYTISDGLHLNPEGMKLLANEIDITLKDII